MRQQSGKKDERDNSSEQYVLEGAPPAAFGTRMG